MPEVIADIFRPPVNCSFCENVSTIPRLDHISQAEFLAKFAYSGHPVVVTGATKEWKALDTFSLEFFIVSVSNFFPRCVDTTPAGPSPSVFVIMAFNKKIKKILIVR
jgi:hypothetical protein